MSHEANPPPGAERDGAKGLALRWRIATLDAVDMLDLAEMIEGYWDGIHGEPEPGDNRSPAFWHGWRNGASDKGLRAVDEDQRAIARQVCAAPGRLSGKVAP